MRNFLAFIGPLIAALGFLPYLKETLAGTVRPRIASWATWTMVTGIGTVAALSEHAYTSAFLTGISTLVEATILIVALRKGDHDYNWIDGTSQLISVAGVVGWLRTSDAALAIVFNIIADFFGAIPTMYHSWIKPHDESWKPFLIGGFGAFISCLSVSKYTIIDLAFPVYLASVGSGIGFLILIRQKIVAKKD